MNLSSISLAITRPSRSGAPWTAAQLWPLGASSPGLWIDPTYTASEFQESTGVTALSAIGTVLDTSNPVGLILDRKGGSPGPELITDYTTGWTAYGSANVSLVSSEIVAIADGSTAAPGAYWTIPTVVGRQYQVFGTLRSPTTNTMFLRACFAADHAQVLAQTSSYLATATRTGFFFTATSTTTWLFVLGSTSVAGNTYAVSAVSVKENSGIHLSQATSAARPVASARKNQLISTGDLSTASWVDGDISGGSRSAGSLSVSSAEGYAYIQQFTAFAPAVDQSVSFDIVCDQTVNNVPIRCPGSTSVSTLVNCVAGQSQRVTLTGFRANGVYLQLGIDARSAIVPGGSDSTGYTVTLNNVDFGFQGRPSAYQAVVSDSSYTATGFPVYAKLDGTDDSWASAAFAAGTLTSSMDALIAVRRDSAAAMMLGLYEAYNGSKFFGVAESGAAFASSNGCGTPTVWVDGTQLAGGTSVTRATLFTAITAGVWHVLEYRGLDLSAWVSSGYGGGYTGNFVNGALGGIQLFASGQDANRTRARAAMAAYFGVTLA